MSQTEFLLSKLVTFKGSLGVMNRVWLIIWCGCVYLCLKFLLLPSNVKWTHNNGLKTEYDASKLVV